MLPHEHHEHCGHEHSHDKRFYEFINAIHTGDVKKALKQIRKVIAKGVQSKNDALLFRIAEAIALHKLAEFPQAEDCLAKVGAEMVAMPDLDGHVIEIYMNTARVQGMGEKWAEILENLCKSHPKDDYFAGELYSEYVGANKFYKLNILAKDLESRSKDDKYTLGSIYALYMFAKYNNAKDSPTAKAFLKLATMSLDKYLSGKKIAQDEMPAQIFELYRHILLLSNSQAEISKLTTAQKVISPSVKRLYEIQALKELKQYPDCINLMIDSVFTNMQQGTKAEYAHETLQRLVTLLISHCNTTAAADLAKLTFAAEWEAATKPEAKAGPVLPKLGAPVEALAKIFTMLAAVACSGKFGDIAVSTNEVRSSYLGMMLILHKTYLLDMKTGSPAGEGILRVLQQVVKKYLCRFVSTGSAYADSLPFCVPLDKQQRTEIVSAVKTAVDALNKESEYEKHLTATITHYKLRLSLLSAPDKAPELVALFAEASSLYQSAVAKLNKKLEKGERHPADDLVLVCDFALSTLLELQKSSPKEEIHIHPVNTLRMLWLGAGMRNSPANFDIAVQLLKLLMDSNLHYMAAEVYNVLHIKGVVTETLPHFYEKYLIEHVRLEKLAELCRKYEKFSVHNTAELQTLKAKAVKEGNFTKAEELYEYEQCHVASHHKIVLSTISSFFDFMQNSVTRGQNIILSGAARVPEQLALLIPGDKLVRTQDVYTLQPKIKLIPEIAALAGQIKGADFGMAPEADWDTLILDPVLVHYMPIGRTNYRPNIMNVLGVLELPQLNVMVHTFTLIASYFFSEKFDKLPSEAKNFDSRLELLQSIVKGAKGGKTSEEYGVELEDLLTVFTFVSQVVKMLCTFRDIAGTKDPAAAEKGVADCQKLLAGAQEQLGKLYAVLKELTAKRPRVPEKRHTLVTEQHPLLSSLSMRRVMILVQYMTTCGCLAFSVLKAGFPAGIAKRAKKGEASAGEKLKKAITQTKKEFSAALVGVVNSCQSFILNEEFSKWVQDWSVLPEGLAKVPAVEAMIKSEAAAEVPKKVAEDALSSIQHLEVAFRPIMKAIAGIDI